MMRNSTILTLATAALLTTAVSAQGFCSDNTYPVHLVDADGVELPTVFDAGLGEDLFVAPTEDVYLAFDPALPTGTYYVHVTDTPIDGFDEVLSGNDPLDRFVHVENNAGVITLSLPFSTDPGAAVYGQGLSGAGQSILLSPYAASQYSQCRFKVWYGDVWDLSNGPQNPYLLAGGINPLTGDCAVRSYHSFRIGDGTGSDVSGSVFADGDRDGLRGPGEGGLGGQEVHLTAPGIDLTAFTDVDGNFLFSDVGANAWTISLVVPTGYVATTASSFEVTTCDCGPLAVGEFGLDTEVICCHAESLCYWRSCQGLNLAVCSGILPTLPMLCLVNTCGQHVAPGTKTQLGWYLAGANTWNMGYALSAELVALQANLVTGKVVANCPVSDPCFGQTTVGALLQTAVAALCAHPYTPPCSGPARTQLMQLRDALRRLNNNESWVAECGCGSGSCGGGSQCGGGGGGSHNQCGNGGGGHHSRRPGHRGRRGGRC